MSPPTSVEAIIARAPGDFGRAVMLLKDFFGIPERRATLRLAVLAVVDTNGDERLWLGATNDFKALFTEDLRQRLPDGPLRINEKTIKRFALGTHTIQDRRLVAFLAMYVIHQVEQRPNLIEDRPLLEEAFAIGNTLNRAREFLERGNPASLSPHTSGYDMRGVLATVHRALGTGIDTTVENLFFGGMASTVPISNYVMYRYSTKWGEIVKSFITILSPGINNLGCFSFVHVYGPEDEAARRISRGAVIGFQRSVYFLAGGGMIVDKGSEATSMNRGLKAFAIPHNAFAPDHRLLTGLMLSNSLSWHPLIARFAMVHIGFSSRPGELSDEAVRIRFLEREKLGADISDICRKFSLGGSDYAEKVQTYVSDKINNHPTVDLKAGRTANGLLRALTIEEGREPAD